MRGARAAALLVVALGTLTVPLDSAVNIAFPRITGAFDVPLAAIQWVIICYVLTYGSLMLVFGKLGDLFGHRRIFLAGLAISVAAFVACGLAPGYGWLLAARIFQGVGAALVIGCGPALATAYFPESLRPRVLGAYATAFGIGQAAGPSLGGALVEAWGWEAVFWFRAPVAGMALLLLALLPAVPVEGARRTFDIAGAVLLTVAIATLLLAVNRLFRSEAAWAPILALAVASAMAWAAFARRERRVAEPIIRLAVFRDLDFSLLNLASVVANLAAFAVVLLVPYYLAQATGHGMAAGGILLALGAFGMVMGAPVGGWLAGRLASRPLSLLGLCAVAGGLWLVGQWPADAGFGVIAAALMLQGFGMGLFQVTYLDRVTGTLARRDRGVAGSLAMMTRTVGVVLAATSLSHAATVLEARAAAAGDAMPFLTAFQGIFEGVALALAAFLAGTCLRPGLWFARDRPAPPGGAP